MGHPAIPPTIVDPGSAVPSLGSRPSLGQGRPSEMRTAGIGFFGVLWRVAGLLVALFGIAALVAHLTGVAPLPFGEASPSVDLRDLRALRTRTGALVLVGEIHNVTGSPIGAPHAKITLFDASRAVLGSATCEPPIRTLSPSERVPCAFSFGAVAPYATMDVSVDARPLTDPRAPAALSVIGAALARPAAGAELDGTVKNAGTFAAKHVTLVVSFYGADGKLAGAASAAVRDLEPGASAPFSVVIADTAAPPRSFAVRAVGYRD